MEIRGTHAIVTAAGSGIGRQIAVRFAEAGVNVSINDVDEDALAEAREELDPLPGDIYTDVADASDSEAMESFVEDATDAFGGLDVLVNNVGVAGPTEPCEEISSQEFMKTLRINVGGQFNAARAAIPHLRQSEDGRIVNISSMSGKRPLQDRTPYVTAKMGIIGFTRTLAVELADDDVNVNAICPGSVEGPRLNAVIEGQARSQGRSFESVEQEFREVAPMREFVDADDVADMVLVLCSTETDRVTGQDINVTAGIIMH
jgi:NAD(P)-dependent dehydrogenase (short-subunit alcohol dehydrogenase family)